MGQDKNLAWYGFDLLLNESANRLAYRLVQENVSDSRRDGPARSCPQRPYDGLRGRSEERSEKVLQSLGGLLPVEEQNSDDFVAAGGRSGRRWLALGGVVHHLGDNRLGESPRYVGTLIAGRRKRLLRKTGGDHLVPGWRKERLDLVALQELLQSDVLIRSVDVLRDGCPPENLGGRRFTHDLTGRLSRGRAPEPKIEQGIDLKIFPPIGLRFLISIPYRR